jgi:hypothetical protein
VRCRAFSRVVIGQFARGLGKLGGCRLTDP